MEIDGARALVCGASGALGGALVHALIAQGAQVVAAGRDADRLAEVAGATGRAPLTFDAVDPTSCRDVVDAAAQTLGGLDLLVVATGVAGFGPATSTDDVVVEELFAVNVLGPIALVSAAAAHLADGRDGATAVVLSAILADLPTNEMAAYSATKSALSAWLEVVRREERRRFHVIDVRPPHLDTGLETRALAGTAPRSLPDAQPAATVVDAVVEAVTAGSRLISWDPKAGALVAR